MARSSSSTGYRSITNIGLCPNCGIIYKQRTDDRPEGGYHRCRECGTTIEFDE